MVGNYCCAIFVLNALSFVIIFGDKPGLQQDILISDNNDKEGDPSTVTEWCRKNDLAQKPAQCLDKLRQYCNSKNNSEFLIICKSMKNITLNVASNVIPTTHTDMHVLSATDKVAQFPTSSINNNNSAGHINDYEHEHTTPSATDNPDFITPQFTDKDKDFTISTENSVYESTFVVNIITTTINPVTLGINGKNVTKNLGDKKAEDKKRGKKAKKAGKDQLKKLNHKLNDRQQKQYNKDKLNEPLNDVVFKRGHERQYKPTELDVNNADDFFHGDMDLTDQQIAAISTRLDDPTIVDGRRKRKVGKEPTFHLWDSFPISYQFTESVPDGTRDIIEKAIKLWEGNTCVRFLKDGTSEDKLEFVNGDGCSSFVGKAGGVQEISLRTPGCNRVGVAAHEIGHSLGFFHEQSRPDQKKNVKVNYPNIQFLRYNNFMPMPWKDVDTFNVPYDYGSVMHYDGLTKGFTYSEDQYSIITVDPLYQHTIGQRVGPSFIDYKLINLAYCSNKCPQKLGCLHNGYENPNNCSECKCPTGFGGKLCDTLQPGSFLCGDKLTATVSPQYIISPNYPNNYTTDEECNWLITAANTNGKIRLEFVEEFSLPCYETCSESYVELKLDGDFQRTGKRLCCDKYPQGQPLLSQSNEVVVLFRSYGESDKGFKLKYWSEGGTGGINVTRIVPSITTAPVVAIATTTTEPPDRTTPKNPAGCQCSEWGTWDPCTQPCGGCGVVKRNRWCNRKDCYITEKRHCNYEKCPQGTSFLWNNGEFHLLVYGCCFGLLSNNVGKCAGLASVWNEWIQNAAVGNN